MEEHGPSVARAAVVLERFAEVLIGQALSAAGMSASRVTSDAPVSLTA
jgi:hypothetical protein